MLSRVDCEQRPRWLEAAEKDPDPSVRETARAVAAWVCRPDRPGWPRREECAHLATDGQSIGCGIGDVDGVRNGWHYIVEVWRSDGLLVGTYAATVCVEDDAHAKCIALGQAVLESTSERGDPFEPAEAAAFIIDKREVGRCTGDVE
jgi:hypothetical protein